MAANETVSQISDDGRWIAFNSYDPTYFRPGEHVGSGRAALYDRATRKTRRLSRWTTIPRMSSVSSDGSRVAYVEMVPRPSGRFRQVWVWDRATGTSRLRSATPHLGESDEPDLSGTGRHLVHTYDNSSWREVHHVDLEEGRLTRLTGPGELWETFSPLVSDDGRTVVMRARERPRTTGYPRWPDETVFVWRQDTGYVDLFPADRFGADQLQLSRDGRFLSYVRGLSDSFVDRPLVQPPEAGSYHHDLRTGRRTKIFEIAERPVRGTISGDGRFVFHSLPWPPRPGGACVDDGGHPGCLVRYDSVTGEITRVPGTLRFPSGISSDGRGTQITYTTDTWDLPEDRPLRGFVVTQTLPEPSLVD